MYYTLQLKTSRNMDDPRPSRSKLGPNLRYNIIEIIHWHAPFKLVHFYMKNILWSEMPHCMLSLLCYFIFFCDNFYTNRVTCHFIIYKEGLITILFHFFSWKNYSTGYAIQIILHLHIVCPCNSKFWPTL